MVVGPNGHLYVAGAEANAIREYGPNGELIQTLAGEALANTLPAALSIDDSGNFYVTTWNTGNVVVLDADGNLLTTFGSKVTDGGAEWPEGSFFQPQDIAVTGDGRHIFVSDSSPGFTYLTALGYEGADTTVVASTPPTPEPTTTPAVEQATAEESQILWLNGSRFAEITPDGDVWINGWDVGDIEENGDIWVEGDREGQLTTDGEVWQAGNHVGDITPDGEVWYEGDQVGLIESDGTVWIGGSADGFMEGGRMEHAAIIFYFDFFWEFIE